MKFLIRLLLLSSAFAVIILFSGMTNSRKAIRHAFLIPPEKSVAGILRDLGQPMPDHWLDSPSPEMVNQGSELVYAGRTAGLDGQMTKRQSRYFVCADCHNQKREDPDLRIGNPETRLEYSIENEIPFLQATTFFGIVNRESWYNGDYLKKYGHLVDIAKNNLRESIQVCSIYCSSGRRLDGWEIDAILAYFWTLALKYEDLEFSESDRNVIAAAYDGGDKNEAIRVLKSGYIQASPAHFDNGPDDRKKGYGLPGDATRGSKIYNQSCLSCHSKEGPSKYLTLDNSEQSRQFFRSRMTNWGKLNLYHVVRYGTEPKAGHEAYMPQYPLERMSKQQVEDLRAYLER